MLWQLINHQDSLEELYLIPWWYPHHPPAPLMLVKERDRAKRKWFIQINHPVLALIGCNTGSLSLQLHFKGRLPTATLSGSLTFHVKKDCHWLTLTFFFFFPPFSGRCKAKILAFKFVAAPVNRCHLWRVRVMTPAWPLWLLGLNNIPPQGFRGGGRRLQGQPQQVSALRARRPHSFSLLCNYHQRTSVCCSSGALPPSQVS